MEILKFIYIDDHKDILHLLKMRENLAYISNGSLIIQIQNM